MGMPQESRTKLNVLKEIYQNIENQIKIAKEKDELIYIMGDFNCIVGEIIPRNNTGVSKGGRLLCKVQKKHRLVMLNSESICKGLWTRSDSNSKSVIDFVLVSEMCFNKVLEMEIDEENLLTPYHYE